MPIDPALPDPSGVDGRIAERLGKLERRIRALETTGVIGAVPVVAALPTAGRKGRLVVLSSDNKLYVDNGSSWVAQT